jgi:hypothetical protein
MGDWRVPGDEEQTGDDSILRTQHRSKQNQKETMKNGILTMKMMGI